MKKLAVYDEDVDVFLLRIVSYDRSDGLFTLVLFYYIEYCDYVCVLLMIYQTFPFIFQH